MTRQGLRDAVFAGPNFQKPNLAKDLVAAFGEFVGMTMFIFLALGGVQAALIADPTGAGPSATQIQSIAFSFGASVMVGLFMCCPYSEGALNPAILLALMLVRKVNWLRGILMFIAELVGAILGAYFANFVTANELKGVNALNPGFNYAQGFFAELLLTFVLVSVILFVIVDNQFSSPSFNPVVVGITLFMVHLVGAPIDGTSVNPARSFGPAIVTGQWTNHWIFWFGPLIGSFLAFLVHACFQLAKNTFDTIDLEKDEFLADNVPPQTLNQPANPLADGAVNPASTNRAAVQPV